MPKEKINLNEVAAGGDTSWPKAAATRSGL
jgi:hypothetical protein